MIEEGAVVSVAAPKAPAPPRLPRWLLPVVAPIGVEVASWLVDVLLGFLRARRFGAFYVLQPPPIPIVMTHTSFAAWLLCATAALVLVSRRCGWRWALCTALLLVPLGWGTVSHKVESWLAPPVPHTLRMVPACERESGPVHWLGHDYELNANEAVDLGSSRARWDDQDSSIVLYVGDEDALAANSTLVMSRHGTRCVFDALTVDGEVKMVSVVKFSLLWGALAITDSDDPHRLRVLHDALTH